MAYTRTWDESLPAGSDPASTIDDIFRNLKGDIRERMNSIVADFSVDPIANLTSQVFYRHWSTGSQVGGAGVVNGLNGSPEGGYLSNNGTTTTINWMMPIPFPVGAVLTRVKAYMYRGGTGVATFRTIYSDSSGATTAEHATVTHAGGGAWITQDSGALLDTITAGRLYYAYFVLTSDGTATNARLAGIEYTITRTSVAQVG